MLLKIEDVEYELEFDSEDNCTTSGYAVAFCPELAQDFLPILFDPKLHGNEPFPPDLIAYRLIVDLKKERLCILYEVYWSRQDCTWRQLNKDHDHDYEQIQIHFNLETGKKSKVVISSVGPPAYAGHGVEVYSDIAKAQVREVAYFTSPKKFFPWGGDFGQRNLTQIRDIPIGKLFFEGKRPTALVLNCYHAFTGVKTELTPEERIELKPKLTKLDQELLDVWYYRNAKNRFGHDISKPFEEPHIMYYPPPEDLLSNFVYGMLWFFNATARITKEILQKIKKALGKS